jgi:UDP-N-acetylmuramoylalanine--D-glutamate ligase
VDLSDVRCLAVLGLRRSGLPAALLARRRLPTARVVALDEGAAPDDAAAELRAAGVEVLTGAEAVLPEGTDLLIKSPGVPNESPAVQDALRRGVALWSEVEFAARFLPNRVIGITGTNGKTTTTELAGALFRDAGLPVAVGGNVGFALAGMPEAVPAEAVVVAELSSFQLEHIERFRPEVAVLLNLTEDHLDRHGDYRGYVDAKLRIFENQEEGDLALLNADDPGIAEEAGAGRIGGRGRRAWFSAALGRDTGPGGRPLVAGVRRDGTLWLALEGTSEAGGPAAAGPAVDLCQARELALKGEHNLQNSLAAAAAACALGVSTGSAARTLCTFEGVPHRLQVAGVAGGVTYINDSKATNVDATLKALTAYTTRVHLILGGYDKGAEWGELVPATEGHVTRALLIGATALQLEAAFAARAAAVGPRATPAVVCGDLETAVRLAACDAQPGDVVLMSPACASWDQYRDYVERGEHFLRLVHDLTATATP